MCRRWTVDKKSTSDATTNIHPTISYQAMKKRSRVQASLGAAFAGGGGQPSPSKKSNPLVESPAAKYAASPAAAAATSINKPITLSLSSSPPIKRTVYCDLDGVLVDFNAGVESLFVGRKAHDVASHELWARIGSAPQFWSRLQWTRDGEELWNFLVNLWLPPLPVLKHTKTQNVLDGNNHHGDDQQRHPVIAELRILTGVSRQKGVGGQKYNWCKRELNVECQHFDMAAPKSGHRRINNKNAVANNARTTSDENSNTVMKNKKHSCKQCAKPPPPPPPPPPRVIRVITCWSKNKHYESGPGRYVWYSKDIS
jgi:hypothetical protein